MGCLVLFLAVVGLAVVGGAIKSCQDGGQSQKARQSVRTTQNRLGSSPSAPGTVNAHRVYAKKAGMNIRKGPGAKYAVVGKTSASLQPLDYVSQEGEWYKLGDARFIHESVILTESQKTLYDAADLMLIDWSWSSGYGWVTAEGQVKNISGGSLKNVEVVVTWLDQNGQFITSDSAIIEYNPILGGQTSPFKVMAQHNPAMKRARVDFKNLLGGSIGWITSE